MKKISFIIATLFLLLSMGYAQNTNNQKNATKSTGSIIFAESFDGTAWPPAGWNRGTGQGLVWNRTTIVERLHGGVGGAASCNPATGPTPAIQRLITPQITIPSGGGYELTFFSGLGGANRAVGTLAIIISTTDVQAASFIDTLRTLTIDDFAANNVLYPFTIPLDAYSGPIYVAFSFTGANVTTNAQWFVDEVRVATPGSTIVRGAIENFTSPTVTSGINSTTQNVSVALLNTGDAALSGFNLRLEHTLPGASAPVVTTVPFPRTIAQFARDTFTFPTPLDVSAAGAHTIRVVMEALGNVSADTARQMTYTNTICHTFTGTFPFVEDFEAGALPACWIRFGTAWGVTQRGEWNPPTIGNWSALASQSFSTTPNYLVTQAITLPVGSNYVLEFWTANSFPTSPVQGYGGVLISKNGNNPTVGTDFVEKRQLTGTELGSATFQRIMVPLGEFAGETIYIAFEYRGNGGSTQGWIIDDIQIWDPSNHIDVEVASIVTPVSGINMDAAEQVKTIIKNNGGAPLTTFQLQLECDELDIDVTVTYAGDPIPAFGQIEYTFNQTLDLSAAGTYTIAVTAILDGDMDLTNNTKSITVTNTVCNITEFPIMLDFETFTGQSPFPPICWEVQSTGTSSTARWRFTWFDNLGYDGSVRAIEHMRGGRSDGGDVESWLVMPAMTLKSGIATLEFMSKGETPTVSLVQSNNSVWISVAGDDKSLGAGFTLLEDLTAIQTADWQKITIDLAAYAGQMVYIAFKYEGSDFTGDVWGSTAWVIDDIEVNSELAIYTVTINEPTHGSILVKDAEDNVLAIGDHQIVDGTVLTLTATPDTDCVFEAWWDGETENPRTVFVEGDMIIDATFIQIPRFKVTIGTSTNGNVFAEYGTAIPIFGEANLLEHTEITMMAVPSTGYRFVEWMDGNKTQNDRKLILTQDTTIFAVFELIPVNSIKDANGKELLNVYPNPVTDVLNIQTEETIKQIVVLDLNGRVVAQFNGNTKTINLQTLPAGNYVVRIHTETAIVPVRIVKQ